MTQPRHRRKASIWRMLLLSILVMAALWPYISLLGIYFRGNTPPIPSKRDSDKRSSSTDANSNSGTIYFKYIATHQKSAQHPPELRPLLASMSEAREILKVPPTDILATVQQVSSNYSISEHRNTAPGRIASHWASFPAGRPLLNWSGRWQRSDNQIDLNLLQGEYENIRVPWLRSFASRTAPHDCPTSRDQDEILDKQSLGYDISNELLIVHSRFAATEVKLHGKNTDKIRATFAHIQSVPGYDGRACPSHDY